MVSLQDSRDAFFILMPFPQLITPSLFYQGNYIILHSSKKKPKRKKHQDNAIGRWPMIASL